jgi:hypothetical protein
MVAAFCGVSGACGFGQAALSVSGMQTAFFGNLWDLALLALVTPALWKCLRARRKVVAMTVWACAMAAWLAAQLLDGDLGSFAFGISASIYASVALTALLLVEQFALDPSRALQNPAFNRGAILLTVCSVDAMVTAMLPHAQTFGMPFLVLAMCFRNLLWVLAYAAIIRSLLLVERSPRTVDPPESMAQHGHMTMSMS